MNADRNLLFGALALKLDLIDAQQFSEACNQWAANKELALADILLDLGWITKADRSEIERLVLWRLQKHGGDIHASLAASVDDTILRTLDQVRDDEVDRSLIQLPPTKRPRLASTSDHAMGQGERYELSELHARGGLGRVWLARDHQFNRDVALKDIHPNKADDPTVVRRFLKEAQITGQLEHPGVVPVYEISRRPSDEQPFYAMRFVNGRTLREAVREYHSPESQQDDNALNLVDLLTAFVAVCNTIAYSHSRGVISPRFEGREHHSGRFWRSHRVGLGSGQSRRRNGRSGGGKSCST